MGDEQLFTEVERARQAADIATHPLFVEAFAKYQQRLAEEWENSPARDSEGRERIWLMMRTSKAVERHLLELMETGKLATIQLEQKRWGGLS